MTGHLSTAPALVLGPRVLGDALSNPIGSVPVGGAPVGGDGGSITLIIVSIALGIVALAAVLKVISTRREVRSAARLARSRAETMREMLQTIRMAETIAGIGIWQYDPETRVQQWSEGLKRLFGVEPDERFVEGDAETLLFANNIDLTAQIRAHYDATEPYTLQFDITGYDGVPRSISVQACNLKSKDGAVMRVVAVVRDITDEIQQVRDLESSRAEAVDEARHARLLAETDPLTGLANRRLVMRELDRLVMDARISQMPLVLVMFDIDHFKQVNDTYGHPAGDRVLKQVAELAEGQARDTDIVGRVGGEEFVWIIPGGADGMARMMTERLRQSIAKGSAVSDVPPVTISLGYTCIQPGDTALSLFARADGALYDAKHSGRNQVRMAA